MKLKLKKLKKIHNLAVCSISFLLYKTMTNENNNTTEQMTLNKNISFMPSFFDTNNISDFKDHNVVYIGAIGICENQILCKFGKTSNIKKRLKDHIATFGENFRLLFVGKTNNNTIVENDFRDVVKSKNLNRSVNFNGENKTELFLTSNEFTLIYAKEMMQNLIQKNPTEELKNFESKLNNNNHVLAIEIEKTKQLEEKRKQLEEKRKTIEGKILLEKEKKERFQIEMKISEENKKETLQSCKLKEKNIYFNFLDEQTEETENKQDRIHCTKLYEIFKKWHSIKYADSAIPCYKEFIRNIKKFKFMKKIKINGISQTGIINLKMINKYDD